MASQLTQAAARHLSESRADHTGGQEGVPAASAANSYSSKQVVIIRICICDDELAVFACQDIYICEWRASLCDTTLQYKDWVTGLKYFDNNLCF